MVLYTAGKMARASAKIVTRPTCGGDKKGGLAPTVGWYNGMSTKPANNATNTMFGLICVGNFSNSSQQAARRARIGMVGL
uniref:Uncharacterized protein n=1 Tax=viral metagenome TaxID=1070528 RepID=A0A6C0HSH9_9ZZZZ